MPRTLPRPRPILSLLALCLLAASTARGQDGAAPNPGPAVGAAKATPPSAALLAPDPFAGLAETIGYRDMQRSLADRLNLHVELGYTMVFQAASDTLTPSASLLSGSYDLVVDWGLVDLKPQGLGSGTVGALVEGGQVITHRKDEDLSANIGSGLGVNDDLDNEDIAVTELWYAHSFADDAVVVTVGKIDQTVYFDANRIANDETAQFLATPLVNNSAIPFPDNGFGVNAAAKPTDWFYVSGGWGNAAAVASHSTLNTIDIDESFWAGEFGLTPTLGKDRQGAPLDGAYRFIGWHVESGGESASGFALSFDQHVGAGLVPFLRYGYAGEGAGDLRQQLSAGIGLEAPFGRPDDLAAFGVVWADFHDESLDEETLVEAFYRIQLIETMTLTPDVQLIANPAAGDSGPVLVAGLRAQWVF